MRLHSGSEGPWQDQAPVSHYGHTYTVPFPLQTLLSSVSFPDLSILPIVTSPTKAVGLELPPLSQRLLWVDSSSKLRSPPSFLSLIWHLWPFVSPVFCSLASAYTNLFTAGFPMHCRGINIVLWWTDTALSCLLMSSETAPWNSRVP